MIDRDLNEAYLGTLRDHLRRLDFPNGVFMTAHLDDSCQGTDYVLRKPVSIRRSWGDLFGLFHRQGVYTYRIPERDENGARTLSRLRDYGINQVANAAAQSADHVLDFFLRLRWELGFYLGALHLHQRLRQAGAPVCLPIARPAEDMALTARNLCDVGLVLRGTGAVVGNDLDADGKTLVMVTVQTKAANPPSFAPSGSPSS
jgi:hypothetical protein